MKKVLLISIVALFSAYNCVLNSKQVVFNNFSFALKNVEAMAGDEYDYAVTKCKNDCSKYTGVCTTKVVNGVAGVKCDYSVSGTRDCCGIVVEYGTVE